MRTEAEKDYLNKRLDKSRMHARNDPRDIKKISNRVAGVVAIRATEVLKQWNFLKVKTHAKSVFERKAKEIK